MSYAASTSAADVADVRARDLGSGALLLLQPLEDGQDSARQRIRQAAFLGGLSLHRGIQHLSPQSPFGVRYNCGLDDSCAAGKFKQVLGTPESHKDKAEAQLSMMAGALGVALCGLFTSGGPLAFPGVRAIIHAQDSLKESKEYIIYI